MSTTIDQRVVEMRFDNKQFEQNVSTTMSTLDKLKHSLKFKGASEGLENLEAASKKVDFKDIENAAYTSGFSVRDVWLKVASVFEYQVAGRIINAARNMVSALTIDPIKTGFSEYETQINAVQTILANTESKGKTLEDVNGALDELNKYADKTIYNFTEMTRNIGTFTAAGVDLDTSVSAIKGIANLAAVSGSTSQQASTAMYQLSQAMASGTVKLMDWNSVVNAGMGGQVFQDALKETAKVHGIAIDDIISKQGSFRESLSEGWLTTEILTETLSKFTGDLSEEQLKSMGYTEAQIKDIMKLGQTANDAATKVKTFTQLFDTLKEAAQSGWTQTWEILVGDFEEAKELLTQISDVVGDFINKTSESRNELLENWKVLGGREDLIASFKNIFEGLISVIVPIKDAFREIFPPTTAEQLAGLTEGLKNFTAKLKLSSPAADKLKRTFKGIFAVLNIFKQAVVAVAKGIGTLLGGTGNLADGVLSATASFGDWLVALNDVIKSSDIFNKVCQGIAKILKSVIKVFGSFVGYISSNFISPSFDVLHSILERVYERMSGIGDAAGGMKSGVVAALDSMSSAFEKCTVFNMLQALWKGIKIIGSGLAKAFGALAGGLVEIIGNGDFNGILDFINGIITGGIGVAIIKFIKGLTGPLEELGGFMDGLTGILDGVGGCLEAWQSKLKAEALMTIAKAVAILAASLLVLALIDSDKLTSSLAAITALFVELIAAMAVFSKIDAGWGIIKVGKAMTSLATALLVLAVAMKIMSTMSPEEMGIGLISMVVGLTALVGAVNLLPEQNVKKAAKAIKILASSLLVLAVAIKIMSTMSWQEMGVGLITMVVGLGALVGAVNLLPKKGVSVAASAIKKLASALLILAVAVKIMSTMSWKEMGVGLISMVVGLGALVAAVNLLPKDTLFRTAGMVGLATAMVILSGALKIMGKMSWEEVARGLATLAGSMLILAVGLNAMKKTLPGAAALVVAAGALAIFTPVLAILGAMSWESIAKGLLSIAGAFVVIGVAGLVLKPVIPAILSLSSALLLVGAGILAAGLGIMTLGGGLSALAVGLTAIVGSLGIVVTGIVGIVSAIVVGLIKGVGEGIIALCKVIAEGAPAIADALIAVILSCCDALLTCVPTIATTLFELIAVLLETLVSYTPRIVDALFQFLVGILEGIARNIPDLIQAAVDIVMSIFQGIVDAIGSIDFTVIVQAMAGVGLMAALMAALAAVAALTPGAMAGVLGMGVVIAELAIVLAAIGALAQIPGLEWLISEGGNFLETIGTAIGQFIGGLAGGIAQGFTSSLPQIGIDLADFMKNAQPFFDGAKLIDESVLSGVKSLINIILSLTGANILESITSWVTGESSVAKFATELPILGMGLKGFSDAVSGIVPENVMAAVEAAKSLAEMTATIPNSGGVVSWFTGENSIAKFGNELPKLGQGLKGFADAVSGISPETVTAAANAAKTLAEMTATIPNSGGVKSWFSGENSISKFAKEIVKLGSGLKGFSDSVTGIVPENLISAANAAKTLADMTATIPNEGGVKSWFSGDNSISKFGKDIVALGKGLKGFSDEVVGVVPENVTAAANAAKALAEVANIIPNEGGVKSWFTGDNSLSKFGKDIIKLGTGLKGFSDEVVGIVPENVTAAANAAKTLAEMSSIIPNEGGIKSWFTGESSLSKFGGEIAKLGGGLKGFSDSVNGIAPESVTAGINAAKSLAEMSSIIPNEGGVKSWFTGESSLSKFGNQLPKLGQGLKGFSDAVTGITPENIVSAANAAKALAEMTAVVPKEGGIKAWFTGETSISKFANQLPSLGKGLKGFSDSVAGISPENTTAAANAAKSLGEMTDIIPKNTDKINDFGKNLTKFGGSLKTYFTDISGVSGESVSASTKAIEAVEKAASVDAGNIKSVAKAIDDIADSVKGLSKVPKDSTEEFRKALKKLGETSSKALVDAFKDIEPDMKKAGKKALEAFITGLEDKLSSAKKKAKSIADDCADALEDKKSSFKTAGKNLVIGFANGISENTYRAEAKAKAMAKAAAKAAEKALDINSPSKVFRKIGTSVPEGFAMGIDKLSGLVKDSSMSMAAVSVDGVRSSIARLADVINSDIDTQPTIRPVLDLSDVRSGVGTIGSMLGIGSSIGVASNVGAISSMMNLRNQNGVNDDVVYAINKLRKDLGNVGNTTYNIDGVTYDDGSNIADAVRSIVRAARVERRV